MVALQVLCLLGSLFTCSQADEDVHYSFIESLREEALQMDEPITCDPWDCNCTFTHQRGCCCAANEMFKVEDKTFARVKDLWGQAMKLFIRVQALTGGTKIAFKATMKNDVATNQGTEVNCFGPFNLDVSIPFGNVFLNDGNGYNPSLGIFTAPHAGVYFFSFTIYSNVGKNDRLYHKVTLMMNGMQAVSVWENNREDMEDSATQGVAVKMELGDQVYLQLMSGRKLCKHMEFNIFTGYMLYPENEKIPDFSGF